MMKKRACMCALRLVLLVILIAGFSEAAYASRQQVQPAYGYYKIVAINGHGNGQELYYDSDASKKDLKWKDDGTIWYIGEGDYSGSYCIGLAEDPSYMIGIEDTYIGNDKILKVKQNITNHVIYFYMESGSDPYNNLTITLYDWAGFSYDYKLNRHWSLGNDYVNLRNDSDTDNKLWKLVPVSYSKALTAASLPLTAKSGAKLEISWKKFCSKLKKNNLWKDAKFVEIQYSTDKNFLKNVKTKKLRKGTVSKAKAKTILSKLSKNKKYYVRVRLINPAGVYSNWSKLFTKRTKK